MSNKTLKKMPLENLTLDADDNGTIRKIPAFSMFYASPKPMVQFFAPPIPNAYSMFAIGAKENWLQRMSVYKSNMQWLLKLPYHKFWSQIVYGKFTWDYVISFVQEAYPYYMLDGLTDDIEISTLYEEIYIIVFKIFRRATNQKESEDCFISEKKFGRILYNYTIISLPLLIDLCAIYGERFRQETQEMIHRIIKAQPLYKEDLNNAVQQFKYIFTSLEEQFVQKPSIPGEITKLSDRKDFSKPMANIEDIILYLLDVSASLFTLVDIYKEAAEIFHHHQFEINIASLYDNVISSLSNQVQSSFDQADKLNIFISLTMRLNHTRYFFIEFFRKCIEAGFTKIIEKGELDEELQSNTHTLDIFCEAIENKIFFKDYQNKYPVMEELRQLFEMCPVLDAQKYNFMVEAVKSMNKSEVKKCQPSPSVKSIQPQTPNSTTSIQNEPSTSKKSNEENIEAKIAEVIDVFPHLGPGYILKCLQHYKYSTLDVINAILEESLADELKGLDQNLPIIPPEEGIYTDDNVLINRKNVYDFDEFDVMTRDTVDTSRIHRGKRQDKYSNLNDMIDDKSFREEFRSRYAQLGVVESLIDMYDDEYDDTYDDADYALPDVDENEKKFVLPRVLQQMENKNRAPDSEPEEDEPETPQSISFDAFVENPEVTRERWDQKMANKYSMHRNKFGTGEKSEDRNRGIKNVNKASIANHNRKKGARNKRMQGGLPS